LAGDETVVTKSGKQTHGVDRFFSSLVQKAVPSVAYFVLSLVSVKGRQSYPLLSQQVVRTAEERAAAATRRKAKKKPKAAAPAAGRKRGRPRGSKKVVGVEQPLNAELLRVQGWVRLVMEVVRAVLGGERSLSDLQATYRGWRYMQETIKSLGLKAEAIKLGTVSATVSRLGRIHQECPAAIAV
jgi:hypothetical protein